MKYEIAYCSRSGNTAMLAEEIAELLSAENISMTDLNVDTASDDADVYIIGYGFNRGSAPLCVMDTLELTEGKEVIIFVTSGMEPVEQYRIAVERKVKPFIPDDCKYHGLCLCAGQFPEEVINAAEAELQNDPDNRQAQMVLDNHATTKNRPNEEDIQNVREFVWTKLNS